MVKNNEYYCIPCNLKIKKESKKIHLISKNHLKKSKENKKFDFHCEICDFKTNIKPNMKKHYKTMKHIKNSEKFKSKINEGPLLNINNDNNNNNNKTTDNDYRDNNIKMILKNKEIEIKELNNIIECKNKEILCYENIIKERNELKEAFEILLKKKKINLVENLNYIKKPSDIFICGIDDCNFFGPKDMILKHMEICFGGGDEF